jgi:hypothetical protein
MNQEIKDPRRSYAKCESPHAECAEKDCAGSLAIWVYLLPPSCSIGKVTTSLGEIGEVLRNVDISRPVEDGTKTERPEQGIPEIELRGGVMRGLDGRSPYYIAAMESEKRLYLISLSIDHERENIVHVSICVSGEPKIPTETNQLSLEELSGIFSKFSNTAPSALRKRTASLRAGHGFTIPLFISEPSMQECGLFAKASRLSLGTQLTRKLVA